MIKKRSPNEEQKKAIEHDGGVLLSAGAGSGKTFVLVEHIAYLAENFLKNKPIINNDLRELETYFSSIVLTTFTNKAAFEIKSRLEARLEGDALKALNSLNVTTIDGFCYKLLSQGYFPQYCGDFEIIEEWQVYDKIFNILKNWVDNNDYYLKEKYPNTGAFLYTRLKDLASSIHEVFKSPLLHLKWAKKEKVHQDQNFYDQEVNKQIDLFIKKYLDLKSLNDLFDNPLEVSFESTSKSLQVYKNFLQLVNLVKLCDYESYITYLDFFDELGNKPPFDKKFKDTAEAQFYAKIFELRDALRSVKDDLNEFYKNRNKSVKETKELYEELFEKVETLYYQDNDLSFSDLEYLVCLGLEEEENLENVTRNFKYIIIDEFQDTSPVQFHIAQKIIKNNYKKLFIVGDVKQAIYGFRGGDSEVFENASKLINNNLELRMNYRSKSEVVDFNNQLFEFLLNKGRRYQGLDRFSVMMHKQIPASDDTSLDNVKKYVIQTKEEKINSKEYAFLDAFSLSQAIKQKIEEGEEEVCVLYRRLAPSRYLIQELMKLKIGFSAQTKITSGQDPLLNIFKFLCEGLSFRKNKPQDDVTFNYWQLTVGSVLDISNMPYQKETLASALVNFKKNIPSIGLFASFFSFCLEIGLSSTNSYSNLSAVQRICHNYLESVEKILGHLDNQSFNYSYTFSWGEHSHKVKIMTAHASKGLEFSSVLLGGVSINAHNSSKRSADIGEDPWAFKWKLPHKKQSFKTPHLLLEEIEKQEREFSESKRLFYVACTRAVNSLSWAEIRSSDGKFCARDKDSWAYGLMEFESVFQEVLSQKINDESNERPQNLQILPLPFRDGLGLVSSKKGLLLGQVSELSVTQLALLLDCPRKFYLKTICKIDPDDIDQDNEQNDEYKDEDFDIQDIRPRSNAQRGTHIHSLLEKMALGDKVTSVAFNNKVWIQGLIEKAKEDFELIPEKVVKFPLFNQMIAAIPDLILKPIVDDKRWEIWDYKTGNRDEEQEKKYEFQLKCYAYSLYVLGQVPKEQSIKVRLLYIDMKEDVQFDLNYQEILSTLSHLWPKLSALHEINSQHCQSCIFGNICHG